MRLIVVLSRDRRALLYLIKGQVLCEEQDTVEREDVQEADLDVLACVEIVIGRERSEQ